MNFPWFDIINFICFLLIAFYAGRFIESEKKAKESKELSVDNNSKRIIELLHKVYAQILISQDKQKDKSNADD